MPSAGRYQKRASDSLELEFQMVMSHHVDTGNHPVLIATEPFSSSRRAFLIKQHLFEKILEVSGESQIFLGSGKVIDRIILDNVLVPCLASVTEHPMNATVYVKRQRVCFWL